MDHSVVLVSLHLLKEMVPLLCKVTVLFLFLFFSLLFFLVSLQSPPPLSKCRQGLIHSTQSIEKSELGAYGQARPLWVFSLPLWSVLCHSTSWVCHSLFSLEVKDHISLIYGMWSACLPLLYSFPVWPLCLQTELKNPTKATNVTLPMTEWSLPAFSVLSALQHLCQAMPDIRLNRLWTVG